MGDALKCVLRGKFMAMAFKRKPEHWTAISDLTKNIRALELTHKKPKLNKLFRIYFVLGHEA